MLREGHLMARELPAYVSGHCGTGNCQRCRGQYKGTDCHCNCHTPTLFGEIR
jgi:hypothetical protein